MDFGEWFCVVFGDGLWDLNENLWVCWCGVEGIEFDWVGCVVLFWFVGGGGCIGILLLVGCFEGFLIGILDVWFFFDVISVWLVLFEGFVGLFLWLVWVLVLMWVLFLFDILEDDFDFVVVLVDGDESIVGSGGVCNLLLLLLFWLFERSLLYWSSLFW